MSRFVSVRVEVEVDTNTTQAAYALGAQLADIAQEAIASHGAVVKIEHAATVVRHHHGPTNLPARSQENPR